MQEGEEGTTTKKLFSPSIYYVPCKHAGHLDDAGVEEEDERHGDDVVEDDGEDDVALGADRLGEVVVAAGVEQPLRGVAAPQVQHGRQADRHAVAPDAEEDDGRLPRGDLDPAEALDDDVVAVVADDHHVEDGHAAADGAQEAVHLAPHGTPHPVSKYGTSRYICILHRCPTNIAIMKL